MSKNRNIIRGNDDSEKTDNVGRADLSITAAEFVASLNNPDDIINIRIIPDRKDDLFTGSKLTFEVGKFVSIEKELWAHNDRHRAVSFVVNHGGDKDADIDRINAFFVEMDNDSFAEQWQKIQSFPLEPSAVIMTRKSLHVYWFAKDAEISNFRSIQKALVKHFDGDPACVNLSRCMRLPGFYHHKTDTPVKVTVERFSPQLRYSETDIFQALGEDYNEDENMDTENPTKLTGTEKGLSLVTESCDFIRYCIDNAKVLSEPLWYAMITVLAPFERGREAIHDFSKTYPDYNVDKTDAKIEHFFDSNTDPMTCEKIESLGFKCEKRTDGFCTCKSPAAKCYEQMDTDTLKERIEDLPVTGSVSEDIKTSDSFIKNYMFNTESAISEALIKHDIKEHFRFSDADIKILISTYKSVNKAYNIVKELRMKENEIGKLPKWYRMKKTGPEFIPDVLADDLAASESVFCIGDVFYLYDKGVYKQITKKKAQKIVRDRMLTGFIKISQINDAFAQWEILTQRDSREINANPYLINTANCIFDALTGEVIEHDPKYLNTVQIPVSYNLEADCVRFKAFLEEVLPQDQIPLIQEWLGYVLIPTNRIQKCLVIVGEANAGKSILLRVINEILLGWDNTSNVSWQSLNERFKPAELYGKLANIFADLPTKNIDDNGVFKALVGEDFITVERKNQDPFSFQSFSRLIFSCNSIPMNYGDKSEGFYRRLCIVRFDHAVAEDKKDVNLIDKLKKEGEGILNFAIEGLQRLIRNNYVLSETAANKYELDAYRESSNPVLAFTHECLFFDTSAEESRSMIYEKYKGYCTENGHKPCSQTKFNAELELRYPEISRGKDATGRRKIWRGLRLTDVD